MRHATTIWLIAATYWLLYWKAAVIAAPAIIIWWLARGFLRAETRVDVPLALYLAVAAVSTVAAGGIRGVLGLLWSAFSVALLYRCVYALRSGQAEPRDIEHALLVAATLVVAEGAARLAARAAGIGGWLDYGTPIIDYGWRLALAAGDWMLYSPLIIIAAPLAWRRGWWWWLAAAVLVVVAGGSRGAWFALVVVVVVMAWWRWPGWVVAGSGSAGVALLGLAAAPAVLADRASVLALNGRAEFWRLALADFASSPLWGMGFGWLRTFPNGYAIFHPHNAALYVLITTGVVGTALWGVAMWKAGAALWAQRNWELIAASTGLAAFAMFNGVVWQAGAAVMVAASLSLFLQDPPAPQLPERQRHPLGAGSAEERT